MRVLEGTNIRASGIRSYFPCLLMYQDFWSIISILKWLYCFWCSLRCTKIWIVIYYMGLKYPQKAVDLLLLGSDRACSSLNGQSTRKCALLFLVWCYKARCDREQVLRRYWLPEGCIKQWCDKPTVDGCPCNIVGWGSSGVMFIHLVPYPNALLYSTQTQVSVTFLMNTTDQTLHWCSR